MSEGERKGWITKKEQRDILPSFLNRTLQRSGKADLGKNSHPSLASATLPRIPSEGS